MIKTLTAISARGIEIIVNTYHRSGARIEQNMDAKNVSSNSELKNFDNALAKI